MSQVIKNLTSGGVPPNVPTSFQTDNGTAVPLANVLIIHADDSRENNTNGITAKGGVVGTGTSNEVDIIITNRLQGTVTTVGNVTSPIITFTPSVTGTYAIEVRIAAFNTTSVLGAGYSLFCAVRFDSGSNTSTICDDADQIDNEEGTMATLGNANSTITTSGADILINGKGYVGQTINWSAVGLYTFVGV